MNLVPPIDLEMEAGEPEAFATLVARVGRKATQIAPEALADHVMRIVPRQEWPVRVEALDAILRRLDFAKKDGLRINKRPEQGAVLGAYGTRRRGAVTRPYNTVLSGLRPLGGLCDCPDYLKNSLGLCKHLLIIANDLYSKPQLLHRGLREQGRGATSPASASRGIRSVRFRGSATGSNASPGRWATTLKSEEGWPRRRWRGSSTTATASGD
jgi:hypothetical protein